MHIVSVQQDNVTVILVRGNLDAATAQEAIVYFTKEIEAGHVNLVFDFSSVPFLSSAGIRAVLVAMQDTRAKGGDVRLAGAEGNIMRVLEMAGLTHIMKTFDSVREAVTSYSSL